MMRTLDDVQTDIHTIMRDIELLSDCIVQADAMGLGYPDATMYANDRDVLRQQLADLVIERANLLLTEQQHGR